MRSSSLVFVAVLPILVSYLFEFSFYRRLFVVVGALRDLKSTVVENANDFVTIDGMIACEDLHYHASSNEIFTACEASIVTRSKVWFPALGNFNDPIQGLKARGSIHVIDVETKKSRRLELLDFDGAFITHGIDVIDDAEDKAAVYIVAVNHSPSEEYLKLQDHGGTANAAPKLDARIEVFHHILGSNSARRVRSIKHPLITVPNDVIATDPSSFYVTIDHYYTHGFMRFIEDLVPRAKWSTIVQIQCSGTPKTFQGKTDECTVTTVLSELQNNNGLGHGRTSDEVLIGCAISGEMHVGQLPQSPGEKIKILETVQYDSTIDNPSYFRDPYANTTLDASGIVNAGLTRAINLVTTASDPDGREGTMAWYSRPKQGAGVAADEISFKDWENRMIFEDDGERLRCASSGVLVAIDPKKERGKRKAWLFLAGPLAKNIIAVKVDL